MLIYTNQDRIAVVMTVFNRKLATVDCLTSLEAQVGEHKVSVIVVDDGSTDGTREAIETLFPDVTVVSGTGDLYWNGGMRLALDVAYERGFDYYLWLNDDVVLDRDALDRLLSTSRAVEASSESAPIIVGSMRDPLDSHVTYGGVTRIGGVRPLYFELMEPGAESIEVETMNGNCVLVPSSVANVVGNLSARFRQKMGDYDYGLRARQAGFSIWVAKGTYGTCARNPERSTTEESLGSEIRRLWSVKELPFWQWTSFARRWAGPLWPLYAISPYLRGIKRLVVERIRL